MPAADPDGPRAAPDACRMGEGNRAPRPALWRRMREAADWLRRRFPAGRRAATASDVDVAAILASGLFDEGAYAGAGAARAMGLHPAAHYLLAGEAAGLPPSAGFDPVFYKARYPELAARAQSLLMHYVLVGRAEGREALPIPAVVRLPTAGLQADRPTLVMIVPDAAWIEADTWGGAMVRALGARYNVAVFPCRGDAACAGVADLAVSLVTLPDCVRFHAAQAEALAHAAIQRTAPAYVIAALDAAGAECSSLVLAFEQAGVPVVALVSQDVHAAYPPAVLHALFTTVSKLVFSTAEAARAMSQEHRLLDGRSFAVLPHATGPFDAATTASGCADLVDGLGQAAIAARAQARRDLAVLAQDGAFNAELYLGPRAGTMSHAEAAAQYLRLSALAAPRGRAETGRLVRRPLEGFHPLVYAAACPEFDEAAHEDPLGHYLRTGRPAGPWQHQVIRAGDAQAAPAGLRAVLHGHFHYPELLEDLIVRLRGNRTVPDLVLTTSSAERARTLGAILRRLGVAAVVEVVPNRGRDVAPLLTAFGRQAFAGYDIVGHVHGKRSPQEGPGVGDRWRRFAWEHLIGGRAATMDAVIAAMATDPSLGLVFPEDPQLSDWNENRAIADGLAARIGCDLPLPDHFDFPLGTMFWARPAALAPLQALGLAWDDFPPEPLPVDGSMVHALERLLPFSARHAGYRYATTIVQGCAR